MRHYEAVKYAHDTARASSRVTREGRLAAAERLGQYGVFSNHQIATFTGLRPDEVGGVTGKTDRTGGRLSIEALPKILAVMEIDGRGEVDYVATKRALDAGCSSNMLARLTGRPQNTLSRHARKAAELAR